MKIQKAGLANKQMTQVWEEQLMLWITEQRFKELQLRRPPNQSNVQKRLDRKDFLCENDLGILVNGMLYLDYGVGHFMKKKKTRENVDWCPVQMKQQPHCPQNSWSFAPASKGKN